MILKEKQWQKQQFILLEKNFHITRKKILFEKMIDMQIHFIQPDLHSFNQFSVVFFFNS